VTLRELAQAAADAVRQHGWQATPARAAVGAFQAAQAVAEPRAPLKRDEEWGPKTRAAAVRAGASSAPPAYFAPPTLASVLPAPAQPPTLDMQPAAFRAFFALTPRFEGYTPYMYPDSKGFVTTGIGDKIDSPEAAQALEWVKPDGSIASPGEVAAAWHVVKNAYPAVQSTAAAKLTDLRLSKASIARLALDHLEGDLRVLRGEFPSFPALPASAQLALEFIAWAWGSGFPVVWDRIKPGLGTQFRAAIAGGDFSAAASIVREASAHEESINRGIVPRDLAVEALLLEAAAVKRLGLSASKLFYPNPVGKAAAVGGGALLAGLLLAGGLWAIFGRS